MTTNPGQDPRWWVIIPMKRMDQAKSRFPISRGHRRQLAILMVRDTLCAVVNADTVAGALVVCQREEDIESFSLPNVRVIVRPDLPLNEAISAGVDLLRAEEPMANVASLPGDLPYLHSSELDVALRQAGDYPRAVIGDRDAQGTTLLTAVGGIELAPSYGPGSLLRHTASGATELSTPTWSGLRRDVDLPGDLVPGPTLGRRTRAMAEGTPELQVPA